MKTIGILALQGDIEKHAQAVKRCGAQPLQLRYKTQLESIDGLIIPGGESTTIGKLLVRFDLFEPLATVLKNGLPVFGTCAGLILLAKRIVESSQPTLGLLGITVSRNAYGPQVESFEAQVQVPLLGTEPVCAVFIRAPIVMEVDAGVEVLSVYEDKPILLCQEKILAASFHPELTDDLRIHKHFLSMI